MVLQTSDIERLIELRDLKLPDVLAELGLDADDVDPGYRYEALDGLAMVETDRCGGSRVYFADDDVAMIVIPDPSISIDILRSLMGSDVIELRSRQGKTANLEVDAVRGLAFSADDDEVGFVEIFPPTTAEGYARTIYREPPPFRK